MIDEASKRRRVLLKLSGEAFGGGQLGVNPDVVSQIAREIVTEISRNEGKPEAALPKIVEGRVNAFFKQVALLDQDYAKDNKLSVAQVAKDAGLTLTGFARFKVGA